MNHKLPKSDAIKGVLSSSGKPELIPSNNAGMPRDPELLERLIRMHNAKLLKTQEVVE